MRKGSQREEGSWGRRQGLRARDRPIEIVAALRVTHAPAQAALRGAIRNDGFARLAAGIGIRRVVPVSGYRGKSNLRGGSVSRQGQNQEKIFFHRYLPPPAAASFCIRAY